MLVGKEAGGGGGEHHQQRTLFALQSKCLQRDRKPGQGSCGSSFFVVPPYANLASASWHGQLAMAGQAHCRLPSGQDHSWSEGRGQSSAQTLLVPVKIQRM